MFHQSRKNNKGDDNNSQSKEAAAVKAITSLLLQLFGPSVLAIGFVANISGLPVSCDTAMTFADSNEAVFTHILSESSTSVAGHTLGYFYLHRGLLRDQEWLRLQHHGRLHRDRLLLLWLNQKLIRFFIDRLGDERFTFLDFLYIVLFHFNY